MLLARDTAQGLLAGRCPVPGAGTIDAMATTIFTLVFGAVFVLIAVHFVRGERRAAARGQRRVRRGYIAACLFLGAMGVIALVIAVPALFAGGSGDGFS